MTELLDRMDETSVRARRTEVVPPKMKAIKWWAAIGCIWLAVYGYSVVRWIASGNNTRTPTGPSDVPEFMKIGIAVWQVLFVLFAVVAAYYALVRPWRRERRLTTTGIMFLAMITAWGQDPWANYFRPMYLYNSAVVNFGCPQCFIPGWQGRLRERFAEPTVMLWFFYFGFTVLVIMLGCKMMAWFHRRWPQYGRLGPFLFIFVCWLIFDLVTEVGWMLLGIYVYPSVWKPLTLFYGHYYQLPVYELFFAALFYTLLTSARYYTNDKGQILSERGMDEVLVRRPKQRTLLRWVAAVGLFNTAIFLSYELPLGLVQSTINEPWVKDIYTRSYYTQGFCGPHTQFACPDRRVPITSGPDSAHATPDGKLIAPKGLPIQTLD